MRSSDVIKAVGLFSESNMSAPEYALAFYRSMTCWRSLDDRPEHKQWIEVACHYPGMDTYSEVDQYNAMDSNIVNQFGLSDNELIPVAWRPSGPPFDSADEASSPCK